MLTEQDARLITCVLEHGDAFPILEELQDRGVVSVDVHSARAFLESGDGDLYDHVERDIMSVIVPMSRVEEMFEWLCTRCNLEPTGAFIHVTRLDRTTKYVLPRGVPEEHSRTSR